MHIDEMQNMDYQTYTKIIPAGLWYFLNAGSGLYPKET